MDYKKKIGIVVLIFLILVISSIYFSRTAEFEVSDLKVSPSVVEEGEYLEASVEVRNIGNATGTKELEAVFGSARVTRNVTLKPKEVQIVHFSELCYSRGTHQVKISGMEKSYKVVWSPGKHLEKDEDGYYELIYLSKSQLVEYCKELDGKKIRFSEEFVYSTAHSLTLPGEDTWIGGDFIEYSIRVDFPENIIVPEASWEAPTGFVEVQGTFYHKGTHSAVNGVIKVDKIITLHRLVTPGHFENYEVVEEKKEKESTTSEENEKINVSSGGNIIESVTITVHYDNWKSNVVYSQLARGTWYIYDKNKNLVHTYSFHRYSKNEGGDWGGYIPPGKDGYVHLKAESENGNVEWWPAKNEMYKIDR